MRDTDEFVWAVSVPGDRNEFDRVEAAYYASEQRRRVFEGAPQRISHHVLTFAEHVDPVASTTVPDRGGIRA